MWPKTNRPHVIRKRYWHIPGWDKVKKIRENLKVPRGELRQWLLPLATALILTFLAVGPLFKLRTISCKYAKGPCPAIVIAELKRHQGGNLLFFDLAKLRYKLKKSLAEVRAVELFRRLPSEMVVEISLKNPWANLQVAPGSPALLIGEDNWLVDLFAGPDPSYPLIIAKEAGALRVGDQIKAGNLLVATTLIGELKARLITFHSIEVINEHQFVVTLDSEKKAVLSGKQDLSRQLNSLQLILTEATIDSRKPVIDVRYDKPVLRPNL